MKFAYYPGCSSRATAHEYNESVLFTAERLGIELVEIPDWNCCGATSGHVVDHGLALALPSRNLALAEKMGLDMVTPCPSCFLRHKTAEYALKKDNACKAIIEDYTRMPLELSQKTHHIVEVLYHKVGVKEVQKKVKRSLHGLKAVMYYGCYLVRPPEITRFDDPENPTIIDELMQAIEIEPIEWPCKVDCCGGSLSLSNPELARVLVSKIVAAAKEQGAEAIVTACHLCQANLDMYQEKTGEQIPIYYFSELMAIALGCEEATGWLKRHMVDSRLSFEKVLAAVNLS